MADRLARDEQWRRDMTADLSHELRTPLATIQSRIEALEDGVLPATPENLRVIGAEVERLGRLLGALRNLNELESEDLEVEHEPLDLAEVAGDAVARAKTAFAAKGVDLETRCRRRSSRPIGTGCCRSPATCSTTPSSSHPRAAAWTSRWERGRRPSGRGRRRRPRLLSAGSDGPSSR